MTDPLQHYERNRAVYETISRELETVNQMFLNADRFTQKVMLFDSTVYAVLSVQNDISVLRRAFRGYMNADTWDDVRDVCKGVNYGNNKFRYIRENFETVFGKDGDIIINHLETGAVWDAVVHIVDSILGTSYIKAPFVACMLGFTDVLCIDTNVAQMVDDDRVKAKDYSSLEQYKTAIELIEDEFSELSERVSTFMLQWVVFDANRGDGVAKHEEWFEAMSPGTTFGRQTGLDAF